MMQLNVMKHTEGTPLLKR